MKYNERIRNARVDLDMKQYELANEIGVFPKTYSMYKNGLRSIPIDVLNKLLRKLDLSLDYTLELTNIKKYKKSSYIRKSILCHRLKEIRKEKEYSQEKMAKLIGYNQQTLSEYERGNLIIPIEMLRNFCVANNIPSDYVTGRIEERIKIKR